MAQYVKAKGMDGADYWFNPSLVAWVRKTEAGNVEVGFAAGQADQWMVLHVGNAVNDLVADLSFHR